MSVNDIKQILKDLAYKPGWKLNCYSCITRRDSVTFRIKHDCIDVTRPPNPTIVGSTQIFSLGTFETHETVLTVIRDHQLEMHEIDEWLCYKGVHVRAPHEKEKDE